MIYEKLQAYIGEQPGSFPTYMSDNLNSWTHKHFLYLSKSMEMSESSVKRLFAYPGHIPPSNFNHKSQFKLTRFLGFTNWKSLEDELIKRASSDLN